MLLQVDTTYLVKYSHLSILLATQFAYSILDYFEIMPSSIHSLQQFYDYFVPIFFLLCFFVSLPEKLTALSYASAATAIVNVFIAIVKLFNNNSRLWL